MSESRFLHALNYCMVLPGPEAMQLATYIGWLMHRTAGGIAAGVLFVLPSVFILIALAWVYLVWGDVLLVAGLLYGIKPAVVAIVLVAAWRIGSRALRHRALWALAAAAFVAIFAFGVPFPAIVLAAGLVGFFGGRFAPQVFESQATHGLAARTAGPARIDDGAPAPERARFTWTRLARAVGAGLAIWAAAIGALAALFGWESTLTQMAWFFTKAALVTFGGAYAVLPYVYQAAVADFGWVTAAQMMDGLALGETTPGPLIMIVAFVGFVGAWGAQVFGSQAPALAGIAGGVVAAFFTFLPSFIFILAGAPFVETSRRNLRVSAPLTAVTAAVVGVIANLALFFAWHVLWPRGWTGGFEWVSAAIGAAALAALFRFRSGIIPVVGACAAAGLAVALASAPA
ncbi:MAG: chromate efflux transporter [Burkholderiales bacterium]|nr:chromate efflux transporter [Burkholderiales bacterium]